MTNVKLHSRLVTAAASLAIATLPAVYGCAPKVVGIEPAAGRPGTIVNLSMKYLVGWPRVEIAGQMMDWGDLKLLGANPESDAVRGEDLIWIEDKILQFRIPNLPAGKYVVTVYDDKGPPGQPFYSVLETAAYVAFPPVWPFVFRSNRAQTDLEVLPHASAGAAE
jgi:hypothetical protein